MDDAFLVRGLERLRDLARDLERHVERQWSAGETIGQRRPVDELHHDGVQAAGDFEAVNRGDVRMVQGGEQARLPLQARDALRIAGQRRRQHLDGHLAMESRVEGAIHLAHAAGIERPQDAVRSELDARGHRGHVVVRPSRIRGTRSASIAGALGKRPRVGVRREQRFHLVSERDVVAARVAQERRALAPAHSASAEWKISLTRGHRLRSSVMTARLAPWSCGDTATRAPTATRA